MKLRITIVTESDNVDELAAFAIAFEQRAKKWEEGVQLKRQATYVQPKDEVQRHAKNKRNGGDKTMPGG